MRPGDECHRQIQPSFHAARVGLCPPVSRVSKVETRQHHGHGSRRGRSVQMRQVGHQPQVLAAGEQRVDRRELPGGTDHGTHSSGLAPYVEAGDADLAVTGGQQGGEDVDDGRLAGAVGPEERVDGALRDGQLDAVQHGVLAVGLGESGDLDRGVGSGHIAMLEA